MIVRCEECGAVIGYRKSYSYGGPRDDDHIDYGELEPNSRYGGEYLGGEYCEDCYYDLVMTEDALP